MSLPAAPAGRGMPRRLGRHRLGEDGQRDFAALSGDANPLHLDPVAARRTMIGAPAAHGMHLVLIALERALESLGPSVGAVALASLRARFPKPAWVGDIVVLRREQRQERAWRVLGHAGDDLVIDLEMTLTSAPAVADPAPPPFRPLPLRDVPFDDLADDTGTLDIGIDTALARRLFPKLERRLGLSVLADLLALTRLVGMRCPGRHSLFFQLDVTFGHQRPGADLRYRVREIDARFLRVDIDIETPGLTGWLRTFYLPPPQPQPSMTQVAQSVVLGEFEHASALVVGGSRGLGEVTAKILAAGGSHVVITYHRGRDDAERVADEIRGWGGSCAVEQLDALRSPAMIRRLFRSDHPPRTIYYFATPKIFGRRRGRSGHNPLREFIDYYVVGFGDLVDAAVAAAGGKLRVFYPSSIAVEEDLPELAEYAIAKRAAEAQCALYNRRASDIEVLVKRLPRTRTDQTSTLIEIPAEDGLAVMLPIVRQLESAAPVGAACVAENARSIAQPTRSSPATAMPVDDGAPRGL
jgi:acyl dehydratase